jgi:hypothetical protein
MESNQSILSAITAIIIISFCPDLTQEVNQIKGIKFQRMPFQEKSYGKV